MEIPMSLAASVERTSVKDPLLTAEDVASRLNVTKDWVWDHSSRKHPFLPVIRMSDGTLRYRASKIEEAQLFPRRNRGMMGKSHQKGWIVARGRKWYGYFRRKTSNPITQQISF